MGIRPCRRGEAVGGGLLFLDHDQRHFEGLSCMEGMGEVGGHDDHVAGFGAKGFAVDDDAGDAFEDPDHGVERGGMGAEALAFVESEKSDGSGLF